jgi:hypothetical protein
MSARSNAPRPAASPRLANPYRQDAEDAPATGSGLLRAVLVAGAGVGLALSGVAAGAAAPPGTAHAAEQGDRGPAAGESPTAKADKGKKNKNKNKKNKNKKKDEKTTIVIKVPLDGKPPNLFPPDKLQDKLEDRLDKMSDDLDDARW